MTTNELQAEGAADPQSAGFPSMSDVEAADQKQLAHWHRFLPAGDPTPQQRPILDRISQRFTGMTPELSDAIGRPYDTWLDGGWSTPHPTPNQVAAAIAKAEDATA